MVTFAAVQPADPLTVVGSTALLKDIPPAKIVAAAIHAVANGEPAMSPQVMRGLMDRVAVEAGQHQRARAKQHSATARPRLSTRRLSNAEIWAALFMSAATVKAHVSSIERVDQRPDRASYEAELTEMRVEFDEERGPYDDRHVSAPLPGNVVGKSSPSKRRRSAAPAARGHARRVSARAVRTAPP